MKTKKMASMVLAFTMMISSVLLTACGKSSDGNSSQGQASSVTQEDGRVLVGNMYTTGLPIVKDQVTLKIVNAKRPTHGDFTQMKPLKDLEAKTNIHIEWQTIPGEQYTEKKNLMLASNDLPDAFFGPGVLTNSDLMTYGAQGMIIQHEKLIEEYAPNVTKIMQDYPMMKKVATTPDGHMYSVPRARQVGYNDAPDQMFIYKPWLDKLGLAVPTTTDELYKVLTAFKTKDPNNNGKQDEIPFSFRYTTYKSPAAHQGPFSLYGSFGRVDNLDHLVIENNKVVFTAIYPEYKEATIFFNKCFKEGLFDNEAFTQDLKQYSAKGVTKDVTVGAFISWNDFDVAGSDRANDYVIVPPLAGPSGQRSWNQSNGDNNGMVGCGFAITNVNKYPEITMRWVDQFYDRKFSIEIQYGPVGINLIDKGDGTFTQAPVPQGMTPDEFLFKNTPVDAPSAVFNEAFEKTLPMNDAAKKKYNYVEKYYRKYMTGVGYPGGVMFTDDENKKIATMKTDILNYVNDMQAKWLLEGGIEKEWDAYQAKLKQMNIDQYVKILQDAYDRFNK